MLLKITHKEILPTSSIFKILGKQNSCTKNRKKNEKERNNEIIKRNCTIILKL